MTFQESPIAGVWLVDCDVFQDERGSFTRAWAREEFASRNLDARIAQVALVTTRHRGTLRGMHLQVAPAAQAKSVQVIRGAVFDVVVDLRSESSSYGRWFGTELSASNRRLLYVPAGVAHGYQTLVDDTDVLYSASTPYSPAHERGVRWNDSAFGIVWPVTHPPLVNARDADYPDWDPRRGF